MTEADLDTVYTTLCHTMTQAGEANGPLFLARFALLAMDRIGDREGVLRLIDQAADTLTHQSRASQAPCKISKAN